MGRKESDTTWQLNNNKWSITFKNCESLYCTHVTYNLYNALVIANTSSNNTREDSTHGHHHMVNTEIRLIIFFAAKDGEALYSQQKQDQGLTVAQIMNSLLPIQT